MNIEALAIRCKGQKLGLSDVDCECERKKISRLEFFDELARWLAIEFLEDRRDFAFCDSVANNMMPLAEWKLTVFAWSVFHAFDNGEFYHTENSREVDPVDKYTRPMLQKALADSG
jgi:hypothetical protein